MKFHLQSLRDDLESKRRLDDLKDSEALVSIEQSNRNILGRVPLSPDEIFISVANFVENSIALFIGRTPSMYIAFHVNCPHRYLSEVRRSIFI